VPLVLGPVFSDSAPPRSFLHCLRVFPADFRPYSPGRGSPFIGAFFFPPKAPLQFEKCFDPSFTLSPLLPSPPDLLFPAVVDFPLWGPVFGLIVFSVFLPWSFSRNSLFPRAFFPPCVFFAWLRNSRCCFFPRRGFPVSLSSFPPPCVSPPSEFFESLRFFFCEWLVSLFRSGRSFLFLPRSLLFLGQRSVSSVFCFLLLGPCSPCPLPVRSSLVFPVSLFFSAVSFFFAGAYRPPGPFFFSCTF